MDQAAANPFGARTLALLIGAGVVLLFGFLLMSGFGDALRPVNALHPSAASRAAIGFAGTRMLVERLGLAGEDGDATGDWTHEGLLILTPRADTTPDQIATIVGLREGEGQPTLIVLPKHLVSAAENNRNWAQDNGLLDVDMLGAMLPGARLQIRRGTASRVDIPAGFAPPPAVQNAAMPRPDAGDDQPDNATPGRAAFFPLAGYQGAHVLAEPDLINNMGMKSPANAAAAIALFARLSDGGTPDIAFDMTLPRGGRERNLVQLMFTPPFIGVTIAVFAAALLAGFASANRFGPVRREARALALGKAALIDNIANLTRAAGRVTQGGAPYADAMRERLRQRLHAPPGLKDDALVAWLDARPAATRYGEIDHRLRTARTEGELLQAARDLDDWQRELNA